LGGGARLYGNALDCDLTDIAPGFYQLHVTFDNNSATVCVEVKQLSVPFLLSVGYPGRLREEAECFDA